MASQELVDFAEAMGPFLEPAPGRLLRLTDGYALSADFGNTWTQVERIRLGEEELPEAIAAVDAFMRERRRSSRPGCSASRGTTSTPRWC